MNKSINYLDKSECSREQLHDLLTDAKEENNTELIYRISKILNDYDDDNFFISVEQFPERGLAGAKHTGSYKDALDNCGRLKKGYKFVDGAVVKTDTTKKTLKTEVRDFVLNMSKSEFANDYSYIFSQDLDRFEARIHEEAYYLKSVGILVDKVLKDTKYLSVIGFEKVSKKKNTELKEKILSLKAKYGLSGSEYVPTLTYGLSGVLLADGHTVLEEEDAAFYDLEEELTGLGATAKDVEKIVNDLILNKINNGDKLPPWKKSWAAKTSILAQNFVTKKEYSGSNSVILNVLLGSMMPTPYYVTFNQIKSLKGALKKGSKGIPLVYYNFIYSLKDLSANSGAEANLLKKVSGYRVTRKGKKPFVISKSNYAGVNLTETEIKYLKLEQNEYKSTGFLKYYNVFNIADTTGIDYTIPEAKNNTEVERIELAEAIIKGFTDKPKIIEGKEAAVYKPKADVIEMPAIGDFEPIEEYYSTLFHEMMHSTMHEDRLNRIEKYKGKEDKSQYAFEELIAELGASYLCGVCGILDVTHINSAAYLKGWHKKLQEHTENYSDFFIYATREAQKGVNYILKDFIDPKEKKKETKKAFVTLEWSEHFPEEDIAFNSLDSLEAKFNEIPEIDIPTNGTYIKNKITFYDGVSYRIYISAKGDYNPKKESLRTYLKRYFLEAEYKKYVLEEEEDAEDKKAKIKAKARAKALILKIKIKSKSKTPEVYVEFRDSKNGHKPTKKDFQTFNDAWEFIKETFDTPSKDFIQYY